MSIAVAPRVTADVQIPTELETTYTELDRELDRALCKQYLQIWLRHQGTPALDEQPLTFAMFEAAADRLALHAA